jgi:hypothetical protein
MPPGTRVSAARMKALGIDVNTVCSMKMKKILLMAMAVAAMAGCSKDVQPPVPEEPAYDVRFTTVTETLSKTYHESNEVKWAENDRIAVFNGTTGLREFCVDAEYAGKSTGEFTFVGSGAVSGDPLNANIAYYPYSADLECSADGEGFVLSGNLPASQTYAENSLGNGAFPMVAVTASVDDRNLAFRNLCGLLKIQLRGDEAVKSIVVSGNDGEILAGVFTVKAAYTLAEPVINFTGAEKSVTLVCPAAGVQLSKDAVTNFFVALPPMTFAKGFTIEIAAADGSVMRMRSDASNTIKRSRALKMPVVDFVNTAQIVKFDYGFDAKYIYHKEQSFSENIQLQNIDVDKAGNVYAVGIGEPYSYIVRISPDGTRSSEMKIGHCGHGTGFAIEDGEDGVHVWMSAFGSLGYIGNDQENLKYQAEQAILRFAFEPGTTYEAPEAVPGEVYYIGAQEHVWASVDYDHGLLAVFYGLDGERGRVRVFDLVAAKSLSKTSVNLSMERGSLSGGSMVKNESATAVTVQVKDLTTLDPIYAFSTSYSGLSGDTQQMQGFTFYKDRLYWVSGSGSDHLTQVATVYKDGTVLNAKQDLHFEDDGEVLVGAGLTYKHSSSGQIYFEVEGMKVHDGHAYFGYDWDRYPSDWITFTHRFSVIRFDPQVDDYHYAGGPGSEDYVVNQDKVEYDDFIFSPSASGEDYGVDGTKPDYDDFVSQPGGDSEDYDVDENAPEYDAA